MIRSFSYAAYAALFAFAMHAPDEYARARAVGRRRGSTGPREAFLTGYRRPSATADAESAAAPVTTWPTLLDAFMLDKALYELAYELNNRPDWVRIPLSGSEADRDGLQISLARGDEPICRIAAYEFHASRMHRRTH